MKGPALGTPRGVEAAKTGSANAYCDHASARQIRVYMPYADANTVRLRAAQSANSPDHVSWLYEIPGGWGWTICRECRARERRSA